LVEPSGRGSGQKGAFVEEGVEALNDEQLQKLARYFDEEVMSTKSYKPPWVKVSCAATR
jgi:hypothetical protein